MQRDRNHNLVNRAQNAADGPPDPPQMELGPLPPQAMNPNQQRPAEHGGNLGAEHQALLVGGRGPTGFQPYLKPSWFAFRVNLS